MFLIISIILLWLSFWFNFQGGTIINSIYILNFLMVLPVAISKAIFSPLINYTKINKEENWIQLPFYWILGVISLNIPYIINSFIQSDPRYMVILFLVFVLAVKLFYAPKYFADIYKKLKILTKSKFRPLLNINRYFVVFWLLALLYYVFVGSRTEFISYNSDITQNIHLANIFNIEHKYNLFAYYLTPQSTTIQYTTLLTPVLALSLYFFDYKLAMLVFLAVEIIFCFFIYWQRYSFFRTLSYVAVKGKEIISTKISVPLACIASFWSVILFFGGIYMPGTLYNQNILVWFFPIYIHLVIKRKLKLLLLTSLLVIPFHFTMFVIMLLPLSILYIYTIKPQTILNFVFFKLKIKGLLTISKLVIVGLIAIVGLASIFYLYELNYGITKFFLGFLKSEQFRSSVDMFSNLNILQIIIHNLGPVLVVLLLSTIIIWAFGQSLNYKWAIFIVTIQLLLILMPVPNSERTITFLAIPFILVIISFLLNTTRGNQKLSSIFLIFIILSQVIWIFSIRSKEQDIIGNPVNYPLISRAHLSNINKAAEIIKSKKLQNSNYQIISDYVSKQYLETALYKIDDIGTYEENNQRRKVNQEFLLGIKTDICNFYKKEYVVYFLSERTEKWKLIPGSLAGKFSYSIWSSKPTTEVESATLKNFSPKTDANLILETSDYHTKLLIYKCI